MSDIKSLVKVDIILIKRALDNYNERLQKIEQDHDLAILKYKDGYKFSWWDKVRGRHKWTSERLFEWDRNQLSWYRSSCEHLYLAGLLTWDDMCFYRGMGGIVKDFLKNVLETEVEEIYLDASCLSFVKHWVNGGGRRTVPLKLA